MWVEGDNSHVNTDTLPSLMVFQFFTHKGFKLYSVLELLLEFHNRIASSRLTGVKWILHPIDYETQMFTKSYSSKVYKIVKFESDS